MQRLRTFDKVLSFMLAFMLCAGVSGCGKTDQPNRYELSGKALFDGKPIPEGTISFSPDSTKGNDGPGNMADIKEGKFVTRPGKGIVGGPYIVVVYGYSDPKTPLFLPYEFHVNLPGGGEFEINVPASAAQSATSKTATGGPT